MPQRGDCYYELEACLNSDIVQHQFKGKKKKKSTLGHSHIVIHHGFVRSSAFQGLLCDEML